MSFALATDAQYLAIAATSAKFTNPMVPGRAYRFTANTDCWVFVGVTGGAAQASTAGNHLVLSGQTIILKNPDFPGTPGSPTTANAFVHVIRNTADGKGTLSDAGGL